MAPLDLKRDFDASRRMKDGNPNGWEMSSQRSIECTVIICVWKMILDRPDNGDVEPCSIQPKKKCITNDSTYIKLINITILQYIHICSQNSSKQHYIKQLWETVQLTWSLWNKNNSRAKASHLASCEWAKAKKRPSCFQISSVALCPYF